MTNRMLPWMRLMSGLLWVLVCGWTAPAQAQAAPPLSVSFWGTPDPALPGDTVVYKVVLANPSTTTATGVFNLNVSPPQFATVTSTYGGTCTSYEEDPKIRTSG